MCFSKKKLELLNLKLSLLHSFRFQSIVFGLVHINDFAYEAFYCDLKTLFKVCRNHFY